MMILSDNGVSKVEYRDDGFVYKIQPKFLTDNEIWCLDILKHTGYVPPAEQIAINTIKMKYILPMLVTDPDLLSYHFSRVLKCLQDATIRHGDLTEKNVIVNNNKPYIIDFAESRLACDPRLDKRREGDEYWLRETFKRLCSVH